MEYTKEEADEAVRFVRHIKKHLDEMEIDSSVRCKICGKNIEDLRDDEILLV